MKKTFFGGVFFMVLLLLAGPALAADKEELERRLDALADEVDGLKGEGGEGVLDKVTVHGYGEMHFNVPSDGRQTSFDNHRFVIGIHARLADWIHLNAEIDYEHAAQELEFEMAYLDFLIHPAINFRTGVMLLPVGFLNEYHEPPLFWTVERPLIQSSVIPTSWSGAGAGIFGTPFEGVNYRLYVVNSLQSVRVDGCDNGHGAGGACGRFRASSGIRSGRLQPDEAIAEDLAVVGRVELTKLIPGLQVGASFYTGETTHDLIPESGRTTLLEGDVKYRWNWFEMNSTVAGTWIDDATALNNFAIAEGTDDGTIPDEIFGWNVQVGIHVPQLIGWNTRQDIVPYFLYEEIDTQASVPFGFMRDLSRDLDVYHFGVAYLPIDEVSLKADFQIVDKADGTSDEQINFGVAYMY